MSPLSLVEARILGCLLEKERTTPENYPLSLNALVAACNQTTNREPVTAYDEQTVDAGISALREKKLVTALFGAGSRVQKYRHNLLDHFTLERSEIALLCVLLLRGPQTAGELRTRTERLFRFATVEEMESRLDALSKGDSHLVELLPQQPGRKERRFIQCLSAAPEAGWQSAELAPSLPRPEAGESRMEALGDELAVLRQEIAELRTQFAEFRKQFE